VLSRHGNRAFIFLSENTIVTGRLTENNSSLCFFDLSSDEEQITPYLTLALRDGEDEVGGSLRIRFNLGIPIHHGAELRVRVPFVLNPSRQILYILVSFVDTDGDLMTTPLGIAIPLSELRDWARTDASLVEWHEWRHPSMPVIIEDLDRATFTMGSRFVTPDMDAVIAAVIKNQPNFDVKASIPLHVYNLCPHRGMGVKWESSQPHCEGIPGVWNTVALIHGNGSHFQTTRVLAEPTSDILMTEDSLIIVETVRPQ